MYPTGKANGEASEAIHRILELIDEVADENRPSTRTSARLTGLEIEHPYPTAPMRCPCCCGVLKCVFVDCDIDGKHEFHVYQTECTCEESRV
jgi:hypothetical protein